MKTNVVMTGSTQEKSARKTTAPSTNEEARADVEDMAPTPLRAALNYQRDLLERSVLFWDVLRQRADNMIAHERAGRPPQLDFDYELLADARRFEHPANYVLLRVILAGEDCLNAAKAPVIVVDPRAGLGSGESAGSTLTAWCSIRKE